MVPQVWGAHDEGASVSGMLVLTSANFCDHLVGMRDAILARSWGARDLMLALIFGARDSICALISGARDLTDSTTWVILLCSSPDDEWMGVLVGVMDGECVAGATVDGATVGMAVTGAMVVGAMVAGAMVVGAMVAGAAAVGAMEDAGAAVVAAGAAVVGNTRGRRHWRWWRWLYTWCFLYFLYGRARHADPPLSQATKARGPRLSLCSLPISASTVTRARKAPKKTGSVSSHSMRGLRQHFFFAPFFLGRMVMSAAPPTPTPSATPSATPMSSATPMPTTLPSPGCRLDALDESDIDRIFLAMRSTLKDSLKLTDEDITNILDAVADQVQPGTAAATSRVFGDLRQCRDVRQNQVANGVHAGVLSGQLAVVLLMLFSVATGRPVGSRLEATMWLLSLAGLALTAFRMRSVLALLGKMAWYGMGVTTQGMLVLAVASTAVSAAYTRLQSPTALILVLSLMASLTCAKIYFSTRAAMHPESMHLTAGTAALNRVLSARKISQVRGFYTRPRKTQAP